MAANRVNPCTYIYIRMFNMDMEISAVTILMDPLGHILVVVTDNFQQHGAPPPACSAHGPHHHHVLWCRPTVCHHLLVRPTLPPPTQQIGLGDLLSWLSDNNDRVLSVHRCVCWATVYSPLVACVLGLAGGWPSVRPGQVCLAGGEEDVGLGDDGPCYHSSPQQLMAAASPASSPELQRPSRGSQVQFVAVSDSDSFPSCRSQTPPCCV